MTAERARPSAALLRAFGALVRSRREQARLSVAKVAKRARFSDQTLQHIEAGRVWPSWHTLIRLVSVAELRLTWDELAELNRGGDASRAPTLTATAIRLCTELESPCPDHLAVYRWLPRRWEPGRETGERQRLESFLRVEGWELISEEIIGDPVAGTFYLFRRSTEGTLLGTG